MKAMIHERNLYVAIETTKEKLARLHLEMTKETATPSRFPKLANYQRLTKL